MCPPPLVIIQNIMEYVNSYAQEIARKTYERQEAKLRSLIQLKEKESPIKCKHQFYERVSNLSNIHLDRDERDNLSKGLKYNLPYK